MNAQLVSPFVEAFFNVLPQFGFQDIHKGKLGLKEKFVPGQDVNALVALTKKVNGQVAYSMSEGTAKKLASRMMCGMQVEHFDEMAQSAIAEIANMLTGHVAMNFEKNGLVVDISPPQLVMSCDVEAQAVPTLSVEILTDVGAIEVCVSIEQM